MNIKRATIFIYFLLFSFCLFGQTGFKYQAVIRDNGGSILGNQNIGIRFGIIQDNILNPPIYTETHAAMTNAYGVVNVIVGQGTVVLGDFSTIDWGGGQCFLKIEIDVAGGTNYTDFGTSEILNVPRAMYAEVAGSLQHTFGFTTL